MLAYCDGVADVFKALADPTRRAILDELTERDGQTLFEICARLTTKHGLGSTRQAMSQHLAVLEEAGLVRTPTGRPLQVPRPRHGGAGGHPEALAASPPKEQR